MNVTMDLFVVQSKGCKVDIKHTLDSFKGIVDNHFYVQSLRQVIEADKSGWYGIIYDDEVIDDQLLEGLKVFLELCDADVFVLLKIDGDKVTKAPRIFRQGVELISHKSLMPAGDVKFETVLNGWVYAIN